MRLIWLIFGMVLPIFAEIYDDAILSCNEIKQNSKQIFSGQFSANVNIEFSCTDIDQIEKLFENSIKISGESYSCIGNLALSKQNDLKFKILSALFEPEIYAKTLPNNDEYEKNIEKYRSKIRYFASESLDNFLLVNTFNKNYTNALKPIISHFESKGIDNASAIYYAMKLLGEFVKFSGENLPDFDMNEFQKRVSNPQFNKFEINELIYSPNISKSVIQSIFKTALLYEKDLEILNEIIKLGVDINSGYENMLFFALKNQQNVKFLIQNKADVNYANLLGETPLFKAVTLNDLNLIKILVENGADTNARLISENTKLAYSSNLNGGFPSSVRLCDFDATSRTILMQAARVADVEILEYLIEHNADIDAIDAFGLNALDHAEMAKNHINSQYLKMLGLQTNLLKE